MIPLPEALRFRPDGLRASDRPGCLDGTVLMLAYMNEEALEMTRHTGYAHFWSRSRQALWKKARPRVMCGGLSPWPTTAMAMHSSCRCSSITSPAIPANAPVFYAICPCRRLSLLPLGTGDSTSQLRCSMRSIALSSCVV